MSSLSVAEVQHALKDAPVATLTERRAYGNRRGVPDVVVWLSPGHDALPSRTLPVLVELEGTFGGAAADFEKFARRYSDDDYQYHLQWPAGAENLTPLRRATEYDIAGVPARRLNRGPAVTEREMYVAIGDWFEEFSSSIEQAVNTREYNDTVVLYWELTFRMYGHEFNTKVPYFVQVGDDLQSIISQFISPPTIPSVVIINEEYGSNKATAKFHDTMVEFPELRAIRFSS